jgi:acetyl esterase/lipase
MSWLLLILGAWCAVHAVNGWRPVRRNRVLFLWSFMAAWLTIEAAPLWLVLELVAGALLVWAGALDSVVGWIGLALLVGSWLYLVVLFSQGRATAAIATTAIGEFGQDALAGRPAVRPEKVTVERNIVFRRVAGKELKLDVYRPRSEGTGRPAILQIHGGGWIIGDKREQGIPLLKHLASHGWVGFNANYRLSPGATFPDHLIDVKAALVWIRAHAEEYGVDPDFVVVTGGSAGGHLTALMALTANDPAYQPGFETADTSVAAAVPFYGVYDFTNRNQTMVPEFLTWIAQPIVVKAFLEEEPERFAAASPLDQIHPDAPPFFIVHGDKDTLAPVQDARLFARQLTETSTSTVIYVELKGAEHAFDVFGSPRTRRMVVAAERFLFTVHDAYLHHPSAAVAPNPS